MANIQKQPPEVAFDRIFRALAHGQRRGLLDRLARGPATVGELAAGAGLSAPVASKQLRRLAEAGLIEQTAAGRLCHCALRAEGLAPLADWVETYRRFWSGQLDALAAHLADVPSDE